MKKVALVALAALAIPAFASEVGIKYERGYTTNGGKTDFNQVEVNVAQAIGKSGFAVGGKITGNRDENHTNGFTGQVGVSYTILPGLYVKGGVGQQFNSGVTDYGFYTYGAGGSVKVANGFRVTGEVERTNSFNAPNPHFTTYKVGGEYVVAKGRSVSLTGVRRLGDVETKGVELGYSVQF